MKVTVFNVQKFSIHDGPGIRTTVFMKGCPLRCKWCHNPESHLKSRQLAFYESKCVSCRVCENECTYHSFRDDKHEIDRKNCILCGKCVTACPYGALEIIGYEEETDKIIESVMRDEAFYRNSGGGMTLSGGEPFSQPKQALELLKKAKEKGLHTCVETCGYADSDALKESIKYVDLFLFDFKETNPMLHKEFVGVDNELILSNLKMLDQEGAKILLRLPIIPGLNDRNEHYDGIAKLASELNNLTAVEIMPYHSLGISKYASIGADAPHNEKQSMSSDYKNEIISIIKEKIKTYTDKEIKVI